MKTVTLEQTGIAPNESKAPAGQFSTDWTELARTLHSCCELARLANALVRR